MDITPLIAADRQVIQSYGAGRFKVSGQAYETPVLVTPDETIVWPFSGDIAALTPDDFTLMTGKNIEILLLGCGPRAAFIKPALKAALKEKGFILEAMDTGAACRTYNVLLAEGRQVAAALIPLSA